MAAGGAKAPSWPRREANDEAILRFAHRYGVLGVVAYREPDWYEEDLEAWRYMAGCARATLDLSARVQRGEVGHAQDWELLDGWYFNWLPALEHGTIVERRMEAEKLQVGDVINSWLTTADVRPSFAWPEGLIFTNLVGVDAGNLTLRGLVAVQLARVAMNGRMVATCSACGEIYRRQGRQAPAGRNNYCRKCGRPAALRAAAAKRRASLRARAN